MDFYIQGKNSNQAITAVPILLSQTNEPNNIDIAKLDLLGAHFKFKDMVNKLRLIINENRQEKRSIDLLNYQSYFVQHISNPQDMIRQPQTIKNTKEIENIVKLEKDFLADRNITQNLEFQQTIERQHNSQFQKNVHFVKVGSVNDQAIEVSSTLPNQIKSVTTKNRIEASRQLFTIEKNRTIQNVEEKRIDKISQKPQKIVRAHGLSLITQANGQINSDLKVQIEGKFYQKQLRQRHSSMDETLIQDQIIIRPSVMAYNQNLILSQQAKQYNVVFQGLSKGQRFNRNDNSNQLQTTHNLTLNNQQQYLQQRQQKDSLNKVSEKVHKDQARASSVLEGANREILLISGNRNSSLNERILQANSSHYSKYYGKADDKSEQLQDTKRQSTKFQRLQILPRVDQL